MANDRVMKGEISNLPSVDVIKNKWKKEDVITFLLREDLNLDLDDEDREIIKSRKISGSDFLHLTTERLTKYGLEEGPAFRLAMLSKKIKGELVDRERIKIKIADAFPQGLPYIEPEPLLRSYGADWVYQPDPALKQILQKEIKEHYVTFLRGNFDKTEIPLYLFLSGSGTGKSRNASEFYQTAMSCFSPKQDKELFTKIKNACVFHVSYENGTNLRPWENPFEAVGTRMLSQLLRKKMHFGDVLSTYVPPDPITVLSLVAKHKNQNLEDITVILIVDSLQMLMKSTDDSFNKDSDFYRTMSSVADLALNGIFLMPCVTSTITCSVERALVYSHRKRVYLPVTSLNPPTYRKGSRVVPVFENKGIMNLLVEDCGGHGRALEVLSLCMAGRSIENCNVDNLMHDLRLRLTDRYAEAIKNTSSDARAIARAILTRSLLDIDKPIPKTEKKPDQFVHSGLIRLVRKNEAPKGYLTAPYIWLWIFVEKSYDWGDPILRDWPFSDYKEQRELLSSPGSKSWRSFENFVAKFRCLKSEVIDDNDKTTISEVHAGARLNGDLEFINHNLQLGFAKHRTDTNSEKHIADNLNVECDNSTVDVRKFKHCIINAPGSPYGDSFISLDLSNGKSVNEVQQCKLTRNPISQELYQIEREKSSSKNDFFILFTTSENCDIKLPERSGIVDGENFKDYFGPFAGRAYRHARVRSPVGKVNINTESIERLRSVYQIGEKRANIIIKERPFTDIMDASVKTSIPMKTLKKFYFPNERNFHTISRILPRFI